MSHGLVAVAVWGYSAALLINLAFAAYLIKRGFMAAQRDAPI